MQRSEEFAKRVFSFSKEEIKAVNGAAEGNMEGTIEQREEPSADE